MLILRISRDRSFQFNHHSKCFVLSAIFMDGYKQSGYGRKALE